MSMVEEIGDLDVVLCGDEFIKTHGMATKKETKGPGPGPGPG